MIRKLLVANRGEIAVRVIRAAREMGIRTVAVYSDADAGAAHVALADEAVAIGPPEPSASYLDAGKILDAARATGAGRGPSGVRVPQRAGRVRGGVRGRGHRLRRPACVRDAAAGGKSEAKALAVRVGVPIVPGHFEKGATAEELQAAAEGIGYPVMLKASAGGGGRGMRAVWEPARFMSELELASEEALKAFGDGSMLVEKLVGRPRHVEVQLLADAHGNVAPSSSANARSSDSIRRSWRRRR